MSNFRPQTPPHCVRLLKRDGELCKSLLLYSETLETVLAGISEGRACACVVTVDPSRYIDRLCTVVLGEK